MELEELGFGLAVMGFGVWGVGWAIFAKTYDDRWSGLRDMARFRRIGMRYDPLPIRRRDRIGGVALGLAFVVGGVVFLVTR